jgi:hypothetical protein
MNNLSIQDKIKIYQEYFDQKLKYNSDQAVVTYFVYQEINNDLKSMLRLFIYNHLKFNTKASIYIFTNHINLKDDYNIDRVIFIDYPYLDNQTMANRVVFNFCAIQYFSNFKRTFLFDADLIPVQNFENLFSNTFNIGLTIDQNWQLRNRFPINGGFLVANNVSNEKIENFCSQYLNSYLNVLRNQKLILSKKLISHDDRPFEEWWGDQYIFFILFNFELPKKVLNFLDITKNSINYRFFNENLYNLQSVALKRASTDFDLSNFLNERKNVFFLHLTGK